MDRRGTFFSEDHLRSTQHEAQTSYELLHGSLCAVCRTLHDQLAHTDALIQQPLLHARVNASRQPAASRSTWGQWVEPISRLHDPANDLDVETAYALLEQAKVSLPVLKVVQANAAWVEALRNSGDLAYVGAAVLYVHLQSLMLYIKTLSVALKRHQEGPDDASSYELKTFVFGAHDPKGAQYFGEAVPSREACYKANPWVDAYAALHTALARVQASRASLSAWVVFFKDADCGKQAAFTEALHVVSEACFGSGPATWVLDWVERCVALNVLEADYQAECRAHALLERSRLKGYCAALEALDGLMGCEREHSESYDPYALGPAAAPCRGPLPLLRGCRRDRRRVPILHLCPHARVGRRHLDCHMVVL